MASHARKKRIEIDAPFAAVPQDLILDTQTSASACRLWGVLFIFHWNDTAPDFDKLADALATTERSVYRWLQELEARHWIGWHRNKGVPDRFTLHMRPDDAVSDTSVNSDDQKLTQRSNKLIPRSKRLTQVSEELTQVSISSLFDPLPMPQNDQLSSDQNHEKIQNGDGDDRARDTKAFNPEFVRQLCLRRAQGAPMNRKSAENIARRVRAGQSDEQTILTSLDVLIAADTGMGAIVDLLNSDATIPPKGHPYERQRPSAPNGADPGRNGTRPSNGRTDRAGAARAPRPGDPAYYKRSRAARTDRPTDPE